MARQHRLSVVLITYNEADRVGEALASVGFADEVLVIDSGSTDDTVALCEAAGARVLHRPFDGYGAQKQFGLEQASHPWVLALDADEVVSPELAASIQTELERPTLLERGFLCNRRNFYLGVPIRHAGWYPDRKLRLVARAHARWSSLELHERLEVDGPVRRLEGDLLHHSYRDLAHHTRKIAGYAERWARDARARGRRASTLDLLFRPLYYFLRRYLLAQGFRVGRVGLILCTMGAWHVFLKYACLLELERTDREGPR